MIWAAALLLPVLLAVAGRALGAAAATTAGPLYRWGVVYPLTGILALHLLGTLLDFAGIAWSPLTLFVPLALLAAAAARFRRASPPATPEMPLGWGDAAALLVLLSFTLFSAALWAAAPDFVYHWGIKGHRFYLARGVDYSWLAEPWNWVTHPDYPNLVPELFAATGILGGGWDAAAMMLWSAVFLAMILISAREAYRSAALPGGHAQAGLAILALTLGAFGIGHWMAGAADWVPAVALAAAVPALLRRPDPEGDFQIAVIAAVCAGSKMEGIPLAGVLLAVQGLRWLAAERRIDLDILKAALRLGLPTAAVGLAYYYRVAQYGLYQTFNTDHFDPSRGAAVFPALLEALFTKSWHGLSAVLFLLPVLLFHRRAWPVAAAAATQLAFYIYVYLAASTDPRYFVLSSFPRLSMHLIPGVLTVALIVFCGQKKSRPSRQREEPGSVVETQTGLASQVRS